jgi:UvrD-like helicase C-terminal domain/AAA domain
VSSSVETLLHSDAPLVVIEAAAGCGKTWTAAKFAREMSGRLDRQRVLLLSHTHAACGEFHRRCEGQGLRIEVETCDSFALKVVAPYATALGLPFPLDSTIGRVGGVSFGTLGVKAVELVQRSPSVARLISTQYPIIILDEHQDATAAQHALVTTLMRVGGSRLRIFGDPMQALHYSGAEQFVDWDALWRNCDARLELTEPRRWAEVPDLGRWITAARAALRTGGAVVMQDAPREVRLRATTGLAGRNKFKDHQLAGKILREFLDAGIGPAVIIAHLGQMVRALAQSANWRAGVNEGAILEHLDLLLGEAETEKMDAATLASAFAVFIADIGSGFTKAMREGLIKRAGVTLNEGKAGTSQKAWLTILAAIYTDPCHRGLAAAMELLSRAPPDGYRIRLGDHAATLRALGRTADPRGHLQALSRLRRRRSLPVLSASTVHKAKGLEFRRVLVCPADQQQYPRGAYGARLLYVAMSRATHELTIVTDAASPLSHLDFEVSAP